MKQLNLSPKVLLVDDDTTLLKGISRTLTAHAFEVETATCAAEARAILSRFPFDVVVCDQQMPGQSGLQFLAEIRDEFPDLVTFLLSGQVAGVKMAEDWAREIGVRQIFSKPCDSGLIASAIRSETVGEPGQ